MDLKEKNVCSHYIWHVGHLPREVHVVLPGLCAHHEEALPGGPAILGRPGHDRASWPHRVAATRGLAFQRTS